MSSVRFSARVLTVLGTLALAACGAGGSNNTIPGGGFGFQCNPGTQVQLARPAPSSGASNVSQIEIVANGNNNTLYNTYGQWNIVVQDNFGDPPITSSGLTLTSDTGGPHPYGSDFFYNGNLNTTLPAGGNWTVTLEQQPYGSCAPLPLGSFST